MATARATPRSLGGIGIALVFHFDNQMAVQTHRGFTVNELLLLLGFSHVAILLVFVT